MSKKRKNFSSTDVLTKENAIKILEWQQSLPIEEMNTALIHECVNILSDQDTPDFSSTTQERIWKNISSQTVEKTHSSTENRGNKKFKISGIVFAALMGLIMCASISLASGLLPWKLNIVNKNGYFQISIVSSDVNQHSRSGQSGLSVDFDNYLNEHNISVALPKMVPSGFVEYSVEMSDHQEPVEYVTCHFLRGDDYLGLSVEKIPDYLLNEGYSYDLFYEMSGDNVTTITKGDLSFYCYRNLDMLNALWRDGDYICSITGNLSKEEMKDMLDSIDLEGGN